ncbi:MAG: efflux RND transporter periplasmic adaptor subunit [Immundisolibacteraceae bacterium]|nr:efflux RND transporter periplasmic adaptor subunit [Immundisolibacteraceae bacterium]
MTDQQRAGVGAVAETLELNQPQQPSLWRARNLIIAALVVLFIAVMVIRSNKAPPTEYQTAPAVRAELLIHVTATGALEPTNKVEVGIEVSGTIATVEVDYNDRVEAGQVLARLDTAKLSAQVLQARATLESARARLLTAQARSTEAGNEYARLEEVHELSGGKVPSQSDLDRAKATFLSAKADETAATAAISEAKARLEINDTDLSKAIIRAPISGIVLDRAVDPGQTVAASLQTPVLFTLAEDLQKMELHVDVDEADVGLVAVGQQATFSVDAYTSRDFPAEIKEVRFAPKTVEGVVTYETVLTVDNSDLALRPGMTATAEILVQRLTNVLQVPNAALRFTPLPENIDSDEEAIEDVEAGQSQDRVWQLVDNKPTPLVMTAGASDSEMTVATETQISVGTELIIKRLAIKK